VQPMRHQHLRGRLEPLVKIRSRRLCQVRQADLGNGGLGPRPRRSRPHLGASHTRCNLPSKTASETRLPTKRKTP
jgi:hypothetical protein